MFAATARLARVAALLLSTTPPPRCGPLQCTAVDEDALLEAFLGEPHPRVDAAQLSVDVPVEERKCSILSDATLEAARDVLLAYGVVCLRGVWQAEPSLVNSLVDGLVDNYDECIKLVGSRAGLTAADSFGYKQIVHRSYGRYDMLLEDDIAAKPLQSTLLDSVLGEADGKTRTTQHWRHQLLSSLLGSDFKVEFTAALLAQSGCHPQDPHADGAHPKEQPSATEAASLLPPHAVQLFLPLCQMTYNTGPTEFWPTSHLPSNAPFASLLPSIPLEANPGDAIIFDFRVVHRGTPNTSGKWRPILYQTVTQSWFVDDFNFPAKSLLNEAEDEAEGEEVAWEQRKGAGLRRERSGFVSES